jgi:hypothetical protein
MDTFSSSLVCPLFTGMPVLLKCKNEDEKCGFKMFLLFQNP